MARTLQAGIAGDMRRASERPIRDRCVARCECSAGRCAAGEEGGGSLRRVLRGRWEFFFWSVVERAGDDRWGLEA